MKLAFRFSINAVVPSLKSSDAAHAAKGGTVFFPAGNYKITASLKMYSGVSPTLISYSNINLLGVGADIITRPAGSIIKCYTSGQNGITAINDIASGPTGQSLNCSIKDVGVYLICVTIKTTRHCYFF